ncbi:MAG: hypothetical protein KA792_08980, partial [Bacteroidales bacterium]|nr:hypothetical protein [Bacteroidales bacterium]
IEGDTDTITVRWNENYTGSAYLKVKPISNCGEAPFSDSLAVTVNPMPQAATVISGESTVCEDSHNIIFSTNSLLNSDKFYWTLPDGAYGSSDSSSISVNFPLGAKNGNISVSGQNECGLGKNASLPIIVNPLPSTPLISPFISNICHYTQSSELLFIAENADSIFISFEPLDAGITQIKDSAINILWNKDFTGNAKIMLKAINECGETNFSDLAEFNINQPLQVDLGTDTTIMLNQSITLYAENNFKSFNWSNGSKVDSTIIVGKDLGWGTHKIYIEVTDSNNCYSSDTILISVDTSTTIFSKSLINPDITIFPNPASQFIYINSLKNLTNIDFAIINYNNKAIISKNIAFIQANSLYKIALPKLPPSLYFIKINNQYFKLNIY